MPKIVIPTGFESEKRKAEQKRRLAEMLTKIGAQTGNYNSWTQVAGQLANALAGRITSKKADKLDDSYNDKLKNAYSEAWSGFNADRKAGLSNDEMFEKWGNNPLVGEQAGMYAKGLERAITEKEDVVKTPDNRYVKQGELIGKGPINDPNAAVSVTAGGDWVPNLARMSAAQGAQGFVDANTGAPPNMPFRDPASQPPATPPAQVGGPAGGGGFDMNLFSPEEQRVIQAEVLRRRQVGGAGGVPPNQPYGSPLSANKPPAGMTSDGKPYWIINGVPYDNPEGR
jgi:hypothetical protein